MILAPQIGKDVRLIYKPVAQDEAQITYISFRASANFENYNSVIFSSLISGTRQGRESVRGR